MSPLAEGSDRIVAEEVLDLDENYSKIEVVLPLAKEDYINDFEDAASIKEFETLYQKDRKPVSLFSKPLKEIYPESELGERRKSAYQNIGRYVVDTCDILIAIWDGEPSHGKGGTQEIIEYANNINCPIIIISIKDHTNITLSCDKKQGLNAKPIKKMDAFNAIKFNTDKISRYCSNLKESYYEKILEGKIIDPTIIEIFMRYLFPYYAKASIKAKRFQKFYKKVGVWAYLLATSAVISVGIGLIYEPVFHYAFMMEFMLLSIIFIMIIYANSVKAHRNWIENRFLTEHLRVGQFFYLAKQEPSEMRIYPYQGFTENEEWLIRIFKEVWDRLAAKKQYSNKSDQIAVTGRGFTTENVNFIKTAWISDQLKYHTASAKINSKKNKRYEIGGFVVFGIAIIAAGLHFSSYLWFHIHFSPIFNNILTLLSLGLPAIGAMLEGIRRLMEFSRNSKRSNSMIQALHFIEKKYRFIENEKQFAQLMKETNKIMMRDVQDWMVMRSVLELEPVA